jgi:hypothetical protein
MESPVTLVTLSLGWLPVAAVFLLATWATHGRRLPMAAGIVSCGEALVVTLLAALWFASLGSGGWPLLFLLLGTLVAGSERGLRSAFLRSESPFSWSGFAVGVARYMAAGALLAWRLG